MTSISHQVEQQILEYESRLEHIDELLQRADKAVGKTAELEGLRQERNKLAGTLGEIRQKTAEEWEAEELAQAGPMGIWDAVAQQLEKLVERAGG
jgi:hypothetical protein